MTWALYVWAVAATALLVSGTGPGPGWLWTTLAVLSLVGAIALLARQLVRA